MGSFDICGMRRNSCSGGMGGIIVTLVYNIAF